MSLRRAGLGIAALFAAPLAGWAAHAAASWLGYGRAGVDRRADPLLDRFMPDYEVGERHEIRVDAPAALTYAIARAVSLDRSPVVRAIFRARELLLGAAGDDAALPPGLVEQTLRLGWRMLAEEPGHELVMGAATKPWEAQVRFHGMEPERFARFDEPGYAQIAWTIGVEPVDARSCVLRTITRVRTTDADARRRFRRYWAVFSPGIVLIRREILRVVRADAERAVQTPVGNVSGTSPVSHATARSSGSTARVWSRWMTQSN